MHPQLLGIGGSLRFFSVDAVATMYSTSVDEVRAFLSELGCPTIQLAGHTYVEILQLERCVRCRLGLPADDTSIEKDTLIYRERTVEKLRKQMDKKERLQAPFTRRVIKAGVSGPEKRLTSRTRHVNNRTRNVIGSYRDLQSAEEIFDKKQKLLDK